MLLFGVYLCFTVRKAPASFNESKHITWSIYNAIILSTFILIIVWVLILHFTIEDSFINSSYLVFSFQIKIRGRHVSEHLSLS